MNIIKCLFAFVILSVPLLAAAGDSVPQPNPAQRPVAVDIAWGTADAQNKAMQFLGSHKAHSQAVASLQQCQTCHAGSAAEFLLDSGRVAWAQPQGPWIGISVGPADGVLRSQLRLPEGTGVVVTQVVPGGPAAEAGVEPHDVLLSVDGKPIAGGEDLDKVLQAARPDGAMLTLKLLRAGQTLEKHVKPRGPEAKASIDTFAAAGQPRFKIGVAVADPDETLRKQLKLQDGGVVVTEVYEGKPAAAAGLKAADVLLSANGRRLANHEALTDTVLQAGETPLEFEVLRGGVTLKITVTPAKEEAANVITFLGAALATNLDDQARQLVLVHPGYAQVLTDAGSYLQLATTQPAALPPAQRLEQMTRQLEELKAAVDALRADLEKAPAPADSKPAKHK
jgi:membrane-associated protease RseP (regulator of RpoE activity)